MKHAHLAARCPAKVNLTLRVLGRRPDGYHELDTLFQAVGLWDTLELRHGAGLSLTCDDPAVPADASNLVLRAAVLFAEEAGGAARDATFHLRKQIPAGGGLGGGSSDAAGALVLLDRWCRTEMATGDLEELARKVGSDVPFFLSGGTALGRGRGDRIERLPFVGDHPLLVGFPAFGISTTEVYRRHAGRLTLPGNDVSVTRLLTHKLPGGNDFGFVFNDLEDVVFNGWPELRTFRDALLKAGASRALLSGSGSAVFGIFPSTERMSGAADDLKRTFPGWKLRPCRTIEGGVRITTAAEVR